MYLIWFRMNLSKPKTRQPTPNLEIEQWVQGSPTNIDQEIGTDLTFKDSPTDKIEEHL